MRKRITASSIAEALAMRAAEPSAEYVAGGTDVVSRWEQGDDPPRTLVDISGIPSLRVLRQEEGRVWLGAGCSLVEVATSPVVAGPFPALVDCLRQVATLQVRQAATVGGDLCQKPKCPYFRQGDPRCRHRGGTECLAQAGDHTTHGIFGNDLCAAAHPSSLGVALVALGGSVLLHQPGMPTAQQLTAEELFTPPGGQVGRENALPAGALLEAALVPLPAPGVRQAYGRRATPEDPGRTDVEVFAVARVEGGTFREARVVLGGVARTPWRSLPAESALVGHPAHADTVRESAWAATEGASPLNFNRYKLSLVHQAVQSTLQALLS
jgi:xanthine dehydrogenase YagS FAD-binding subunit